MGIDIGSLTCATVIIDDNSLPVGSAVVPTGARNRVAIERAREAALADAGLSMNEITSIVSTGYGRNKVDDRKTSVTEITCHAKGMMKLIPDTNVIIDIGGQDSKAILLDNSGRVSDFAMNDKCAAGTGRFLEVMARALEVDLEDMGDLDEKAAVDIPISSVCTVFAESEVVSLIAEGANIPDIIRGLHNSAASRVSTLVRRVVRNPVEYNISMSGGVARNKGMVRALERILGTEIQVPREPDLTGALGAAIIAAERSKF